MSEKKLVAQIHYSDKLGLNKAVTALEALLPVPGVHITYLCIGSDLSTGDSFGPLTGTLLRRLGVAGVLGTLDDTVHAKNLVEKLQVVPAGSFTLAIDATLGRYNEVGQVSFLAGPLRPGAAMQKNLPPVGDASMVFNVAPAGFAYFAMLGCASLNKVWQASNLLARSISVVSYRRKRAAQLETCPEQGQAAQYNRQKAHSFL